MKQTIGGIAIVIFLTFFGYYFIQSSQSKTLVDFQKNTRESVKLQDEWKEKLTPDQYYILREKGTEVPYTSDLLNEKRQGTYYAWDTKEPVFRSEDKFDSGTGWPSFTRPISAEVVKEKEDFSLGSKRVEVTTALGGHLGHVFEDGPEPTGLRYCINGDALYFVPDSE